jgi:hypothetical protein
MADSLSAPPILVATVKRFASLRLASLKFALLRSVSLRSALKRSGRMSGFSSRHAFQAATASLRRRPAGG